VGCRHAIALELVSPSLSVISPVEPGRNAVTGRTCSMINPEETKISPLENVGVGVVIEVAGPRHSHNTFPVAGS
jgi:hypothetical protein